ncbi:hypothetical protein LOD99_8800 [Oopsacas minuta]|uniref:Uncharacterized protein n=1 Tax=Oopsacas minuta TaxID=111878 RepID=A0AAV7JFF0_9METZ|nr:hypothetical protein LOD99_8800 [Oopsacas minuta]
MISVSVSVKLPKLESLKRTIRRQRLLTSNVHPQPTSLEDLEIPEEYKLTNIRDLFLLFDSGPELQRILIFETIRILECLRSLSFGWLMVHLKQHPHSSPRVMLSKPICLTPTRQKRFIRECGARCSFSVRMFTPFI